MRSHCAVPQPDDAATAAATARPVAAIASSSTLRSPRSWRAAAASTALLMALLSALLCGCTATASPSGPLGDGTLSEPDISVTEYEPSPSLRLLDALPLFDPLHAAAAAAGPDGGKRTPSFTKMPSLDALPPHLRPGAMGAHAHTHPHPHAHAHGHSHGHAHPHPHPHHHGTQKRQHQRPSPPLPPVPSHRPGGKASRRGPSGAGHKDPAQTGFRPAAAQHGLRGRPPPPPPRKRSTKAQGQGKGNRGKGKSKATKKKSKKHKQKGKRKSGKRSASNPGTGRPVPNAPRFDAGEVDPAKARHASASASAPTDPATPPRRTGAYPPPPPPGAAGSRPRSSPSASTSSAPSPPPGAPVRELSPREIREQQARLYEQQRAKYAQLVAFHRGEPGAEFPSAFEAGGGEGDAPPPSIEEMREQLRAEGMMQPPAAFDSMEMGMGGGDAGAGAGRRSPFTVPPPRDRRFALPPAPRNPAWKKRKQQASTGGQAQGEGATRRRRRIGPGAVERLTHAQSLRDHRAHANAAKQAQLEKTRARLIQSLGTEETTAHLRAQIQQILTEQIAGMSREDVAAELENLKRRMKEDKGAAAKAGPATPQKTNPQQQQSPKQPAAASSSPPPPAPAQP